MTVRAKFTQNTFDVGFDPRVQALAVQSLESAQLPMSWEPAPHPYGKAEGIREMIRTENGAWGVVRERLRTSAFVDTLVSRLAVHVGAPVAPVFILPARNGMVTTVSMIPFADMVFNTAQPFTKMAAYLKHYASNLPFNLWISPDTDRKADNLCMQGDKAKDTTLADFDYDGTDLADACMQFAADSSTESADVQRLHNYNKQRYIKDLCDQRDYSESRSVRKIPILRPEFERTLIRIDDFDTRISDEMCKWLCKETQLSGQAGQFAAMSLMARQIGLGRSYDRGHFKDRMVDTLPANRSRAAKPSPRRIYHFE